MIDEKIAKVKALIEERERIDRELSALLGLTDQRKRGRPRKDTVRDQVTEQQDDVPTAGG